MKSLPQTAKQVRAFLSGKRTRFCVPVKKQPEFGIDFCPWVKSGWAETTASGACTCVPVSCPYALGERLFVKETHWTYPGAITDRLLREGADTWPEVLYDADDCEAFCIEHGWVKKPSVHLREEHARIFLTIKDCKPMQAHSISDVEVRAEGLRDEIDIWRRWLHKDDVHGFAFNVEVEIKQ